MTKSEIVKKYVNEHALPDQNRCAPIEIRWDGIKSGKPYTNIYNPQTGKKTINTTELLSHYRHWESMTTGEKMSYYDRGKAPESILITAPKKGEVVQYAYVTYVPEYEMLEIARVFMSIDRPDKMKNIDKRIWQYGGTGFSRYYRNIKHNRIYLFKGDSTAYDEFGQVMFPNERGKYYNHGVVEYLKEVYCGNDIYVYHESSLAFRQFAYGHTLDPKDWHDSVDYPYGWLRYYKVMEPRKKGAVALKKDTLFNGLVLRDLKELVKDAPIEITKHTKYSGSYSYDSSDIKSTYIFLDKSDDNWVTRICTRNNVKGLNYRSITDTMAEGERRYITNVDFDEHPLTIVIDKKGKVSVFQYESRTGEYKVTGTNLHSLLYYTNPNNCILYPKDKWNDCEYFVQASKLISANGASNADIPKLVDCWRNPRLLEIYNKGCTNITSYLLNIADGVNSGIKNNIGINSNSIKATINEYLGMTDEQLKVVDNSFELQVDTYGRTRTTYSRIGALMPVIHGLFNAKDLRGCDGDEFKYYVQTLCPVIEKYNWHKDWVNSANSRYWSHTLDEKELRDVRAMLDIKRVNENHFKTLQLILQLLGKFSYNNKTDLSLFKLCKAKDEAAATEFLKVVQYNLELDKAGKTVTWYAV